MRTLWPFFIVVLLLVPNALGTPTARFELSDGGDVHEFLGKAPMEVFQPNPNMENAFDSSAFTANLGQWDPDVKFLAEVPFGLVLFKSASVVYVLCDPQGEGRQSINDVADMDPGRFLAPVPSSTHTIRIQFVNCKETIPEGEGPKAHVSNFFIGDDASRWTTGVPSYDIVKYEGLWDDIDMLFMFNNEGLKYEFHVHPGGTSDDIWMQVEGATVSTHGTDLLLRSAQGEIRDTGLYAYSLESGTSVAAEFISSAGRYSYDIGPYDEDEVLIIDPLISSTYFGGSERERGWGVQVDIDDESVVFGGFTKSGSLPTTSGVYDTGLTGVGDIFITKLDTNDHSLRFCTYIGGSSWEECLAIALDQDGNIYLTGTVGSDDFPTTSGALDDGYNLEYDAYLVVLSSSGSDLLYSTYIGGEAEERGYGITVDRDGVILLTGKTESELFHVTSGAFDTTHNGGFDAFMMQFSMSDYSLSYSTFIGGSLDDVSYSVDMYYGGTYLTGSTESEDFPATTSSYDSTHNGELDVFVCKFKSDGELDWATFIGGSDDEKGYDINIEFGAVTLVGYSDSTDFPTTDGAYDTDLDGMRDSFFIFLGSDGDEIGYSTFIGGSGAEVSYEFSFIDGEILFISGYSNSADLQMSENSYQSVNNGGYDVFFMFFHLLENDSLELVLRYSTFIGGSDDDYCAGIAFDADFGIYFTGWTVSDDFPISDGYAVDETYGGEIDAFLTTLHLYVLPSWPEDVQVDPGERVVTLSWEEPYSEGGNSITGYWVYRLYEGNVKRLFFDENTFELVDNDVIGGEEYSYFVCAVNSYGDGFRSSIVTAVPLGSSEIMEPSAPLDFSLSLDDDTVWLSWSAPATDGGSDILEYPIYRRTESGEQHVIKRCAYNIYSTYDNTVVDGETYYYQISARNEVGEGPRTDELSVTIPISGYSAPSSARDLNATAGNGYVNLTWREPVSDGNLEVNFWIYRGTSTDDLSYVGHSDGNLWYNDTDVTNDIEYFYEVHARNSHGSGPASSRISATPEWTGPVDPTDPVDPVDIDIVLQDLDQSGNIAFEMMDVGGLSAYFSIHADLSVEREPLDFFTDEDEVPPGETVDVTLEVNPSSASVALPLGSYGSPTMQFSTPIGGLSIPIVDLLVVTGNLDVHGILRTVIYTEGPCRTDVSELTWSGGGTKTIPLRILESADNGDEVYIGVKFYYIVSLGVSIKDRLFGNTIEEFTYDLGTIPGDPAVGMGFTVQEKGILYAFGDVMGFPICIVVGLIGLIVISYSGVKVAKWSGKRKRERQAESMRAQAIMDEDVHPFRPSSELGPPTASTPSTTIGPREDIVVDKDDSGDQPSSSLITNQDADGRGATGGPPSTWPTPSAPIPPSPTRPSAPFPQPPIYGPPPGTWPVYPPHGPTAPTAGPQSYYGTPPRPIIAREPYIPPERKVTTPPSPVLEPEPDREPVPGPMKSVDEDRTEEMTFCGRCGKRYQAEDMFCSGCGRPRQ